MQRMQSPPPAAAAPLADSIYKIDTHEEAYSVDFRFFFEIDSGSVAESRGLCT